MSNRKQIILKIKQEQKQRAKEIRRLKTKRKSSPFGYVKGLEGARFYFRVRHIAYCLFRGTPMNRIEIGNEEIPHLSQVLLGQYNEEVI